MPPREESSPGRRGRPRHEQGTGKVPRDEETFPIPESLDTSLALAALAQEPEPAKAGTVLNEESR